MSDEWFWAVLSIRSILVTNDVKATSHCALFRTKEEALVFAQRIESLKRNWTIAVQPIRILPDGKTADLPEQDVPFHDN